MLSEINFMSDKSQNNSTHLICFLITIQENGFVTFLSLVLLRASMFNKKVEFYKTVFVLIFLFEHNWYTKLSHQGRIWGGPSADVIPWAPQLKTGTPCQFLYIRPCPICCKLLKILLQWDVWRVWFEGKYYVNMSGVKRFKTTLHVMC